MVVATRGPKSEEPNKILKCLVVNNRCTDEVSFFTRWFCRNVPPCEARVSKNSGLCRPDLSPLHAGQSGLFDGRADIKQLPLRKRCYRSIGRTLVTLTNSFSTLNEQHSLCVSLLGEFVLRNSIELLASICALIYGLTGECK